MNRLTGNPWNPLVLDVCLAVLGISAIVLAGDPELKKAEHMVKIDWL